MNAAKFLDELWIGVKGQSNSEISCSLRNNFRVSLERIFTGVEHWIPEGAYRLTNGNQTPNTVKRAREIDSGG